MLSLKIAQDQIKVFMNTLLKDNTFDTFEVRGAEIISFTHFNISGTKIPAETKKPDSTEVDSLEPERLAKAEYCLWRELRPYAFHIIKGSAKPRSIKIIFSLKQEQATALHDNAAALYLNLIFNGTDISFTTATAQKVFVLDKSLDIIWQEYITDFFKKNNIIYELNE